MSFWTAVVIVVAIWALVTVWTRRHDREMGVTRDEDGNPVFPPQSAPDTSAAEAEIAELKKRIAVLERIATDNNSNDARERARIASEIEALREAKPPSLPADKTPESRTTDASRASSDA
ncbi:MAG: hypothetical protein QNI87_08850 [Erythrobacter sp.]|uniref:hypothetical protein n=1 Tax=Erythrobacter sp. TaxID=1042 RepID=UPI00262DB2F8|nr:hypothetical protein [Erythrobacter sp.]MDJ0978632.1 hypothetical protein [Erythrobacter sp.]